MDEEEAIARLRSGDICGLELLVHKYQLQAVRAAYLIAGDRLLAEDLVQTAFLRAYERIDQFDLERPFGPWFLRIVVNLAVKAAARNQRQVSLDNYGGEEGMALAELLTDPNPGPEQLLEQAENRQAVWEALGKLSASDRVAIVLRYYLGLTEAEIANQLGRSTGTIKWRLHAARERLKPLLASLRSAAALPQAEKGEEL